MISLLRLFKNIKKEEGVFINDHRVFKRYDIPLKLNYSYGVNNIRGESLSKNISRHGLRFPVNARIPKGAMLDLVIENPYGASRVKSKARVMWTEKFVSGDDAKGSIHEIGVRLFRKNLF
jgi:hypothetical protein